jgi:serine phosphatase RsbU (regulator of sigma subunit)
MPTRFERPPGTITAGAVLLVALVVSVVGSWFSYTTVRSILVRHEAYDGARERLAQILQLQTDEETALRGYLSTGKPYFLEPLVAAQAQFDPTFADLVRFVNDSGVIGASAPVLDMRRQHTIWELRIEGPLVKNANAPDVVARLERGKIIMDRIRNDYSTVARIFDSESQRLFDESSKLLRNTAIATAGLILLFGVAALIAETYRSRSQAALTRERAVTDTLQRAFLSGWDVLPYLRVGTAYVSSTREAAIGGDLFDVYRLDDHRALIMVADVSGKGVAAAVETALVKYSIRTLAESESDPALILHRFNAIFERAAADPGAFVSVFLGIVDDRDLMLAYASAGHGSVFVRRGSHVATLPATGPLIGLDRDQTFVTRRTQLGVGDVVVLATDGLTEARDQAGIMLGEEQTSRWIERGDADPQRLADEVVASLRRYAGGRVADDLALLIIRVQRAPVTGEPSDGQTRHEVTPEPADGRVA